MTECRYLRLSATLCSSSICLSYSAHMFSISSSFSSLLRGRGGGVSAACLGGRGGGATAGDCRGVVRGGGAGFRRPGGGWAWSEPERRLSLWSGVKLMFEQKEGEETSVELRTSPPHTEVDIRRSEAEGRGAGGRLLKLLVITLSPLGRLKRIQITVQPY